MRGLYLNIRQDNLIYDTLKTLQIPYKAVEFPPEIKDKGLLIYNPDEWQKEPVYHDKDLFVAVYGWFVYRNEKNNLERLAEDFKNKGTEILDEIDGGIFLIYTQWNGSTCLINDLLCLNHHFFDNTSDTFKTAPSPCFFDGKKESSFLKSIFLKQGHLFGNYTPYNNIERLEPGSFCLNTPSNCKRYYRLNPDPFDRHKLIRDIRSLSGFWDKENRIIPLSSGLDSRLILASTTMKVGYCYGPAKSRDRKIANKLKDHLHTLHGFSLLDLQVTGQEKDTAKALFRETDPKPLTGLLFAFRHIHRQLPNHYADFDGFLGDVFQKGSYITFPNLKGFLYILFPFLFYGKSNKNKAERILKYRYPRLNKEEFDFLLKDFHTRTDHLAMNDLKKVTCYELFYGRGTRYIIHGGITMKSQYLTVVPPFSHRPILENLFSLDLVKSLKHANMRRIWSGMDRDIARIKTEHAFHPLMPPFMGRAVELLAKTFERFIRRGKSFERELEDVDKN